MTETLVPSDLVANARAHWGWILVRGLIAIVFGLLAFISPGPTLAALVLVWGVFAFVDGVTTLVAAWRIRDRSGPFWGLVLAGLVGLGAGLVTFTTPGITALVLAICVGAWAVAMGIGQIVAAIRLRKEIEGEFWLGLSGAVSVLFGIYVLIFPGAGALAMVWIFGTYAVVFGAILVALALRLRAHHG